MNGKPATILTPGRVDQDFAAASGSERAGIGPLTLG
jgi:hypothetical protein